MAYPEVMIPPSVLPVSPTEPELVDDQTVAFQPRFARGLSQRQTWGDPLWAMKLRYRRLASADRALVKSANAARRGQAANLRVCPGIPLRGSFPATELLTNNMFTSGVTGWTAFGGAALTVSDQVARITRTGYDASGGQIGQTPTFAAYTPYAARTFFSFCSRSTTANAGPFVDDIGSVVSARSDGAVGLRTALIVPSAAGAGRFRAFDQPELTSTFDIAGSYADLPFTSLARCIVVDNGPNAFSNSDQFNSWTKTNTTVSADAVTAPDGTTTADTITSTNASHNVSQNAVVSSSAADYAFSIAIKAGTRTWAAIGLTDNTLGTVVSYVNLSTGALGTTTTGAGWAAARASTPTNLGDGWWLVSLVARKTGSSTTVGAFVLLGSADVTPVGSGTIHVWRGTFAQSSLAIRLRQTTSTSTTGTAQSGRSLYVKGLPASTAGLLLAGDYFEINGELKRVTANLNSDSAGRGVVSFASGMAIATADNDPINVLNPFGRFSVTGVRETEHFGVYSDFDFDLIEASA